MPLVDSLTNFRASITEANSYVSIAFRRNRSRRYIFTSSERDFITDSAFLKIFIAWETFLEHSFIQYSLGEPSILGRTVVRYVSPLDERHANSLLVGTQKYVDWSNPEIVRRLSGLYFPPGNPYQTVVGGINSDLFDLKIIRNAAAHLTSTTRTQLDSLATRKLQRPCVNTTVSGLLFAVDPSVVTGDTILDSYLIMLDVAAEAIANG